MIKELYSAENHDFIERAREVAEKVMRPVAAKYDVEQKYPWEVQEAIKQRRPVGRLDSQGVRRRRRRGAGPLPGGRGVLAGLRRDGRGLRGQRAGIVSRSSWAEPRSRSSAGCPASPPARS